MKKKQNKRIGKEIINLVYRITGYNENILIEYVRLNNNNYNVFGDLTIQDFFGNSDRYKKIMKDLHYLNRKMKITKIMNYVIE